MHQAENQVIINENYLKQTVDRMTLHAPIPLQTLSASMSGSGRSSFKQFVNRYVGKDYDCSNHHEENQLYLKKNGFCPSETISMMTAVKLRYAAYQFIEKDNFSIFIVVTAGVSNAVDAICDYKHQANFQPGTINIWVIINGKLTEEAFVQCVMTATEAKTKALQALQVRDHLTHTPATGTSTDSIVIATTQEGELLNYAGTVTALGSAVAEGVFSNTKQALMNIGQGEQL